jgi:hypothetical protein
MRSAPALRCTIALLALPSCTRVRAEDAGDDGTSDDGTSDPSATKASGAAGMFVPQIDSPGTRGHRAALTTELAYDGARARTAMAARGELVLTGLRPSERANGLGVALIGGGSFVRADGRST